MWTATRNILAVIVILVGLAHGYPSPPSDSPERPIAEKPPLTPEQQTEIETAKNRFARVGLELPNVTVQFHTDAGDPTDAACDGYRGLYVPEDLAVHICNPSDTTLTHELAHAWVESNFDDDDRRSFLELQGLARWTGGRDWSRRGAEQAAEILTWGVMETDATRRFITTDENGETVDEWRLVRLDGIDFDSLVVAYEFITGVSPVRRLTEERPVVNDFSPEAARRPPS